MVVVCVLIVVDFFSALRGNGEDGNKNKKLSANAMRDNLSPKMAWKITIASAVAAETSDGIQSQLSAEFARYN